MSSIAALFVVCYLKIISSNFQKMRVMTTALCFFRFTATLLAVTAGLSLITNEALSQTAVSKEREYSLKAAYLYNFLRYVTWPEEKISPGSTGKTICVYGVDPFGAMLERIQDRVGTSEIAKIFRIPRENASKIERCDLVFVSSSETTHLSETRDLLDLKGVLSVSDISGFANSSGIFELMTEDLKVKVIMNSKRFKAAGFKISKKLASITEQID